MASLCNYPFCKNSALSGESRCAEHPTPKPKKKYHKWQFDKTGKYIYSTARWIRLSKAYRRNHPFCECPRCKGSGTAKNADLVDHIKEIQDGGEIYDEGNLMSMSRECHSYKTMQAKKDRNRIGTSVGSFKF